MKQKVRLNSIIFGFLCLLLFLVVYLILHYSPMLYDDYYALYFNTLCKNRLSDLFEMALHYGNGRLLGNFTAFAFMPHRVLLDLFRTCFLFVLFLLTPLAFSQKCSYFQGFFLTVLCYFLLAPPVFYSSIAWISGFQNYIPPICLLLICFCLWKYPPANQHLRFISDVALFIFGFCSQLFCESNTAINLICVLMLTAFACKYKSPVINRSVIWLLSTLLGAGVMIAIPKIFPADNPVVDVAAYRDIRIRSVRDFMLSVFEHASSFFTEIVLMTLPFFILLAVVVLWILHQNKADISYRSLYPFVVSGIIASLLLSAACAFLLRFLPDLHNKILFILIGLFFLASYFCMILCAVLLIPNPKMKAAAIFAFILFAGSSLPVFALSSYRHRILILGYFYLTVLLCILFQYGISGIKTKKHLLTIGLVLCMCIASGIVFVSYYRTDQIVQEQTRYIETQMQNKNDYVMLPYYTSAYAPRCSDGVEYVYYYHTPGDITFSFTGYENWCSVR